MVPKTTTHVWTPAVVKSDVGVLMHIRRLAYYKKLKDGWWVYSPDYGWRQSGNSKEWFEEEKKLGYFVGIKRFSNPKFVPLKEKTNGN